MTYFMKRYTPKTMIREKYTIIPVTSVAATKLSSKFHAKVSGKCWQESLKLFDETVA